jgi:hypothetical protein
VGFRQEAAAIRVQLPHAEKHVLITLAWHACDLCGRTRPGVPLLALETGLPASTVRAALATRGLALIEAQAVPPNDGGLSLGQAWVARNTGNEGT